jgi:hypothetical protein
VTKVTGFFNRISVNDQVIIKLLRAIDHGAILYKENMEFGPYLIPILDEPDFQKIIHPLEN